MSNTLRNLMSRGGLSFAHLGRGSRASDDRRDDDDDGGKGKKGKSASDDDQEQDRENGDSKSGQRAAGGDPDDDDDDDDGKGKRSKRASDDNDDDDDSGKGKKGKRAADDDDDERADEDDDDEEEMRGKSASARARRRERARCAAIFACKGAGRNPVLACKLAFTTSMTRSEAIEVLDGAPAPEGSRGRRQNPNLGIDGDRSVSSEQSIAASWDVAFQKAGAKRRR
ncbi:hypothetical protein BX589_101227 [Paraburkholderia fungorum]|jgi:hypothetical protein|uniref:hypothetical protein n=1 Tax=Paraburkholderia fungorum TaxID=134537 RepID=UPI000D4DC9C6|nr:hypothetical protein [Paraburkholderia fungorum]PRZ56577.1 hypothetical protein BX589_101227 [Paraburkholderia fungorum]DAG71775.1 MAG TPA: hypothetical protein [Caudoviricetes sp.]